MAALTLSIVAGPVTGALADGGPDRVVPKGQQASTERPGFGYQIGAPDDLAVVTARPGFGDRIQLARPGFGDQIRYPNHAPQVPRVAVADQPVRGGSSATLVTLTAVFATLLMAGGVWYVASRSKRVRTA
jgi:hypothetical protein